MREARCDVSCVAILTACSAAGLVGCAHTPDGRLQYREIASASEGRNLRYGVYEPPGWDHDAAPWWVLDDVIPAVRKSHPVIDGPGGLHILGVSMGGGGALQIWLAKPAQFGSATIISAPIFNEPEIRAFLRKYMPPDVMERAFGPPGSGHGVDPYSLHSRADLQGARLVFGAAERDLDAMVESNAAFDARLTEAAVPHRYVRFAGHHRWTAWAPMIEYSLCHQLQPVCPMPDPEGWVVRAVD